MKSIPTQDTGTDLRLSRTEFKDFMFAKIVPLAELYDNKGNPLTNIMAYWRRNDLLPFVPDNKWINISLAQLIWLRILDDLREVGFVSAKMQKVCSYFFKDAYDNDLPKKNLELNKAAIKKKILAGTQTEHDEIFLEQIEQTLQLDKALHILKFDVNYLSNFIAASLESGKEGLIYIFFDGRVREFLEDQYMGHEKIDVDLSEPHISLSITHYLKEIIVDKELSSLYMPQILNEHEQKVLKEMRKKNVKQVSIFINGSKKPRIESTTTGTLPKELLLEIKQRFGLKNYDKIVLDTIDENTVTVTRTRKKI